MTNIDQEKVEGLVNLLNKNPYYIEAVTHLNYAQIMLEVQPEGAPVYYWTLVNDKKGQIIDVHRHEDPTEYSPDLYAIVQEDDLNLIISQAESLAKNTVGAAKKYASHFTVPSQREKKRLVRLSLNPLFHLRVRRRKI